MGQWSLLCHQLIHRCSSPSLFSLQRVVPTVGWRYESWSSGKSQIPYFGLSENEGFYVGLQNEMVCHNGAGEWNDSSERQWWCDSKVCAEDAADCTELPSRMRRWASVCFYLLLYYLVLDFSFFFLYAKSKILIFWDLASFFIDLLLRHLYIFISFVLSFANFILNIRYKYIKNCLNNSVI